VKVVDVRTMNRKGKPRRAKFKMTTTATGSARRRPRRELADRLF
jgi:ribosomal protein L23